MDLRKATLATCLTSIWSTDAASARKLDADCIRHELVLSPSGSSFHHFCGAPGSSSISSSTNWDISPRTSAGNNGSRWKRSEAARARAFYYTRGIESNVANSQRCAGEPSPASLFGAALRCLHNMQVTQIRERHHESHPPSSLPLAGARCVLSLLRSRYIFARLFVSSSKSFQRLRLGPLFALLSLYLLSLLGEKDAKRIREGVFRWLVPNKTSSLLFDRQNT